jgi:dipeptidyl aminopeptidase/acylaminoacyl peptidase
MAKKLKFKKILKRAAMAVFLVLLAGFLFLMFYGVPSPPAISTQGVTRVPWKPLFKSFSAIKKMRTSAWFAAWYPPERRMLIYASSRLTPQPHILSEPGGQPEKLISLPDMAWYIQFHPDANGKYFVFCMDVDGTEHYQLYRFDLSDLTYHQFTDSRSTNSPGYFNPQGNSFAYISSRSLGHETDIHIIDPAHPESDKIIYQAKCDFRVGDWSPAGNQLLVSELISENENRLHILDIETGEMKNLFPNETSKVTYDLPVWSKDSKSIYFVSDKNRDFLTLQCLDLSTGNVRPLTADIPWDVKNYYQSSDGNYLALLINENTLSTLYILDTQTEEIWKVADLPYGMIQGFAFHPQRNEVGFTHFDSENRSSIYSYDVGSKKLICWMHKESEDADKLPAPRVIHYPTFDTVNERPRMIPAIVFAASPNFKGPRPVWIVLHGGPQDHIPPISPPPFDPIRKEGITVIAPNYRGSSGYGKTFLGLDDGYLREGTVKDIGALLDWISTQPDLDAQRVAVGGGSYGGYIALESLVHYDDRLRCGIDLFGISNFVTWLENREDYGQDWLRTEFGDEREPEMRTFLESISPVNQADKIKVPLLVFQGKNDRSVPISESQQIVNKVRAQGGEVWYIEAANEGHGITRPENEFYVNAVVFAFLRKYLLEKD